jgi:hypothetical protein
VQAIIAAAASGGGLSLEAIPRAAGGGPTGVAPLLHFLYHVPGRRQFLAPAPGRLHSAPGAMQVRGRGVLSVCLSVGPSVCPSARLSVCLGFRM